MLNEKVSNEKLPELLCQIKTETKITYPFKYDCISGEYLYPDLNKKLQKKSHRGMVKLEQLVLLFFSLVSFQ